MNKENIIQLREYNINRARKNSSTPIYPKTLAKCIYYTKQDGEDTTLEEMINDGTIGGGESSSLDTPVGVYNFDEPLTEGQNLDDSIWEDFSFETAFDAGFDQSTNDCVMIDSTNGKIYTLHEEDEVVTVTNVEDLKGGTIYYDGLIASYVIFKVIPAFGPFPMSITEQLVSTPAYVRNATIHHDGDVYTVGIGTYEGETAVVSLTPGAYYKAINTDYDGIEVLQVLGPDAGVWEHPLYPVINFTGRFLAKVDNVSITLIQGINSAEVNPNTEAGHTYEYSILDSVFSIIDVTPHVE